MKKYHRGQKVGNRSTTDILLIFGGYLWKLKDKILCKTAYPSNIDTQGVLLVCIMSMIRTTFIIFLFMAL